MKFEPGKGITFNMAAGRNETLVKPDGKVNSDIIDYSKVFTFNTLERTEEFNSRMELHENNFQAVLEKYDFDKGFYNYDGSIYINFGGGTVVKIK